MADELVHYSRPSVDVLFESAVDVYGEALLGVILSGANSDGAAGLRDRRIGQPSSRRAPASELARAQGRLMRRCTAASR